MLAKRMGWLCLIGFVLVVAFFVFVYLAGGDEEPLPQDTIDSDERGEITFTVSYSGRDEPRRDVAPVKEVSEGTWLLNPGSNFPLRIYPVDETIAGSVLAAIRDPDARYGDDDDGLTAIIARHNIRCVEVDTYVNKYGRQYRERIEELKASSTEWESASELDRKDLLREFERTALDAVPVRPDVDLTVLLAGEPPDRALDDRLADAFGFAETSFYLKHARRLDRVHSVPADHYSRADFERLAEIGLARRGRDISQDAILANLKLKEMAALVEDLDAPRFTRKAKAIDYLTGLPDLDERMSRAIAFRELFQLQPLPQEFEDIDLDEVSRIWRYDSMIGWLLHRTFWRSFYETDYDSEGVEGWEISACDDERCCEYCREMASKTYSRRNRPRVPLHLGCRCSLTPVYD